MNYSKKKGNNLYDDDYSKIKPGYASNTRKKDTLDNQTEGGFTDVIGTQKTEDRAKALDAQKRYRAELDAQITAKKSTDKEVSAKPTSVADYRKQTEEPQQYNPYGDQDMDQDQAYEAQMVKASSTKGGDYKNKNLTEAELQRLEVQKKRQQEMKDYLDQQVQDKARKKEMDKQRNDDHAKQLILDAQSVKDTERQNQVDAKYRKEGYASDLKKQIQTNQNNKKTALW